MSKEEYMWEWTMPQVKLASYDFTHIEYLSEDDAKNNASNEVVINSAEDILKNDLGVPIFGIPPKDEDIINK